MLYGIDIKLFFNNQIDIKLFFNNQIRPRSESEVPG